MSGGVSSGLGRKKKEKLAEIWDKSIVRSSIRVQHSGSEGTGRAFPLAFELPEREGNSVE